MYKPAAIHPEPNEEKFEILQEAEKFTAEFDYAMVFDRKGAIWESSKRFLI